MLNNFRYKNKKILLIIVTLILVLNFLNITTIAEEERPDLTVEIGSDIVNSLNSLVEGKSIKIPIKIKNIGEKNITSTNIEVALKIDGVVKVSNHTLNSLKRDTTKIVNLTWVPDYGLISIEHLLSIEVDYQHKIVESNENNNVWDKYVTITEGETKLIVTSVYYMDTPQLGKEIPIYFEVKNNGKDTTKPIFLKVRYVESDKTTTLTKNTGLKRDETTIFSYNWTPVKFGMQKLEVDVISDDKTHDAIDVSLDVDVESLPWWNKNWHYRQLILVDGVGNYSYQFNFTSILKQIGVTNQKFESNTIRIVEYLTNGDVKKVVEKYDFSEAPSFNNLSNALGQLVWNVTGTSLTKYYCIYFDVESNPGIRTEISEIGMVSAGNVVFNSTGFKGGWSADVKSPLNNSYHMINELINVQVQTVAIANNVTAEFFYNDNKVQTVYLMNQSGNISWNKTVDFLTQKGQWYVIVNSSDAGGYVTTNKNYFYVNQPDIYAKNISITTNWTPTSPKIYKNDTATFTCYIKTYNASVDDVNVTLRIYDSSTHVLVYQTYKTVDLKININNTVKFEWFAGKSGSYDVKVVADPNDIIDESNEDNNDYTKSITVYGWPDLEVKSITLPDEMPTEGDDVIIDVVVKNLGPVKATDYWVVLYLENVEQDIMKYENKITDEKFTLSSDSSKKISLTWKNCEGGEWLVGVKINVSDTKRDPFLDNNRLFSEDNLKVKSIERNKPTISNVSVTPFSQEQGLPVVITAIVKDDTGLETVTINITDPDNESINAIMVRKTGNTFSYTYKDTYSVGSYKFVIRAVDLSIHHNTATFSSDFTVYEDETDPEILYVGADPDVQLVDEKTEIFCIATDNLGVYEVKLSITTPDGGQISKTMQWSDEGKYVYKTSFDTPGRYKYVVRVYDEAKNQVESDEETLWITTNLDDKDNDGIPDWWEEKYKLDPENPDDAENDDDNDGFTNLREYQLKSNPQKDIFLQNVVNRVNDNALYLAGSIIAFIVIIILAMMGKRRIYI